MGSVRGVLPRLAVLGLAAAGFVVLLNARQADAEGIDPDPVDALDGALAAVPADGGELPLPANSGGSDVPPPVADTEPTLATDVAPELAPAQTLLATLSPPPQPGAIEAGRRPTPPSQLAATPDFALAGPSLHEPAEGAALGADELAPAPITIPPLSAFTVEPDLVGELDVPSVLLSLADGGSLPTPRPSPHPADPEGAFLRPATAPTIVANPSARQATGPSVESFPSFGPPTGPFATDGDPIPTDLGAGSGPARAPPKDAPSDPSHRGSTDHASHEYSALPGTDRIGVTRGESWIPGTDVEMSNTPPEPSVSPD